MPWRVMLECLTEGFLADGAWRSNSFLTTLLQRIAAAAQQLDLTMLVKMQRQIDHLFRLEFLKGVPLRFSLCLVKISLADEACCSSNFRGTAAAVRRCSSGDGAAAA
ncbi:hypothetical protein U9M48_030704 [Paspalum notatum var. saurae]|uniref:Uncharacterized protein n=1 Tax=Paspalum notatum var. saurae TaxID=547442 RepID=A0AAQ3U455_PASNO